MTAWSMSGRAWFRRGDGSLCHGGTLHRLAGGRNYLPGHCHSPSEAASSAREVSLMDLDPKAIDERLKGTLSDLLGAG